MEADMVVSAAPPESEGCVHAPDQLSRQQSVWTEMGRVDLLWQHLRSRNSGSGARYCVCNLSRTCGHSKARLTRPQLRCHPHNPTDHDRSTPEGCVRCSW